MRKKLLKVVPGEWESEAALCDAFASDARRDGWTVYPEQGGWDLLLVRGRVQVGIQAKLLGGVEVLLQALPVPDDLRGRRGSRFGPHYRAILVGRWPGRTDAARDRHRAESYLLGAYCGVIVLAPPTPYLRDSERWCLTGYMGNRGTRRGRYGTGLDLRWYRWGSDERVWTPPFVPDLPAGVPNPKTISPFKIAACRLEIRGRERGGWVCLADARDVAEEVGGTWNPKTLLTGYFVCTGVPVEEGSRQSRWRFKTRKLAPSREFPAVWTELTRARPE